MGLPTGKVLALLLNSATIVSPDNGAARNIVEVSIERRFDMGIDIRPSVLLVLLLASLPLSGCGLGSGSSQSSIPPTQVPVAHGEWTWAAGSNLAGVGGTYGQLGSGAPGNAPGARTASVGWTDAFGDLWLFGGSVAAGFECGQFDPLCWGVSNFFNDLWKFSGGEWAWVGGSNSPNQSGIYGTEGVAASGNVPGARAGAASWTDASGNFWLFGGEMELPKPPSVSAGMFNDLWKYNEGQWTWVSGASTPSQVGVYGTEGQAAPGNAPGARYTAVSWIDSSGNFWIFGGVGADSTECCEATLNDLWKFNAGQWTWMSGSNVGYQGGVYGTSGQAAAGNVPGARQGAVGWTDAKGNLWLFGGYGFAAGQTVGQLNDLWEFTGGQWTWVGGSNLVRQSGVYGVQGTAAPGNVPGARESAVSWTDAAGNFWLFGGFGCDSAAGFGDLNDLWKYSGGEWTWVSGSNLVNQSSTWGTMGTPASANMPSPRDLAQTWVDLSGNLWLFGGNGTDSTGAQGQLNDLWVYEP